MSFKINIWKIPLSAKKPFKDTDKDRVIDIFDCEPRNKKKQGTWHQDELASRLRTPEERIRIIDKSLEDMKQYSKEKREEAERRKD